MSLFVINRYEGEKEAEAKNEKKHLSELLKRIEQRKRERNAQNENDVSQKGDSQDMGEPERKKKKKKKDKLSENSVQNIVTAEDIAENNVELNSKTQVEDQPKQRKKKKRKSEGSQDEKSFVETEDTKDTNLQNESVNDQEKIPEKQNDFLVLGTASKRKKREVKRILPDWLANPEVISTDLNSGPSLEELTSVLDPKLIEVLKANDVSKLFPVQANIVSWLIKCNNDRQQGWWLRDTCVSAPTGSGKTLAYVLPIVQILQSRLVPKIRCLVVVPVQELAAQVYKVMLKYTSHTSLRVGLLSGAYSFQQEQNNILRKSARGKSVSAVDIVVATPGRLVEHILKTSGFSLDDLRFLVIDEADRAADWLEHLPEPHYRAPRLTLFNMRNSKIPAQKLLFSATLSQDPEKLNRLGLFQPILYTSVVVSGKDEDVNLDEEIGDFVGRYTCPKELTELAVTCTAEYKPVAVYELLTRNIVTPKTLVFTNSAEAAHRLALLLQLFLAEMNVMVGDLSAQLMGKQREDVLRKFAAGEIHILVSSDALARGVDVPDVQLVVSYDLPKHINGYIHRAGRTGRAGKLGTAVSVLTSKQVGLFKQMLSNAHKQVPNIEKLQLDSLANRINYSSHVEKLKGILDEGKQKNLRRMKAAKRIKTVIKK